jgi:hypothetical protein
MSLLVRASLFSLALAACRGVSADPPGAAPSPQATAEPAPFANPPSAPTTGSTAADAGPSPEWLRSDQRLAPDVPRELLLRDAGVKEAPRDTRELAGYEIQAVLRTGEGPPAPRASEVNVTAIDAAKHRAEARLAIEVSATRARFVILGGGFVLPAGTELRARLDRYGHLLLWPNDGVYRVAEPGALRALLGERRLDVAPISRAEVADGGEGLRRLNLRTRRTELSTRAARATLELATLRDADDGGTLVCRLLLDLMSAAPSTEACVTDEMPLHAELRWTTRGSLTFDVVSLVRRTDLVAQDLATPPGSLAFAASPPPPSLAEALVPRGELAVFRTAPVDVPAAAPREARDGQEADGLVLLNSTDELRIAWIDGVPAAWVAPGARLSLPSLTRGRYALQWRTFLGDAWDPPALTVVPGISEAGTGKGPSP